jgi:hypothetical protein
MREDNSRLETIDTRIIDEDTTYKRRHHQVGRAGNVVWFFTARDPLFSTGTHIRCRVSTDIGATWGSAFTVAPHKNVDQYWFDVSPYSNGLDFIYFVDSTLTSADQLMYGRFEKTSPTTLSGLRHVSTYPPVPSSRDYNPSLVSYDPEDVGALWVGLDGATRRVYYDHQSFSALDVESPSDALPQEFELMQNYPNPFNPTTTIALSIPKASNVALRILDMLGREVATLLNETKAAGRYSITWDGSSCASGVYFYRLQAEGLSLTHKMLLVR